MSIIKAIILGIVQGITEFLPISSSGHLSLFQYLLGTTNDTSLLFDVMLHMGTLLAVFIVFYKTIWELIVEFFKLIKDIFTGKFKFKEISGTRKMLIMFVFSCLPLLLLLIPVGNGNKLMDIVGGFAEDNNLWIEGICFLVTAFLLLFATYISKKKPLNREVNTTDALAVGVAQVFAAAFPGLSRSGSTIATGMICGVNKEYMVQYSFILGIPAIIAANISQTKDAIEMNQNIDILPTIIGIITAMVVGVLSIKLLQWIMKKDMFKYFGYYCIIIGIFTLACQIFKIHF